MTKIINKETQNEIIKNNFLVFDKILFFKYYYDN